MALDEWMGTKFYLSYCQILKYIILVDAYKSTDVKHDMPNDTSKGKRGGEGTCKKISRCIEESMYKILSLNMIYFGIKQRISMHISYYIWGKLSKKIKFKEKQNKVKFKY